METKDKRIVIINNFLISLFIFFMAVFFVFILNESMKRDMKRIDYINQHNCINYGSSINKHFGRDVCPETYK